MRRWNGGLPISSAPRCYTDPRYPCVNVAKGTECIGSPARCRVLARCRHRSERARRFIRAAEDYYEIQVNTIPHLRSGRHEATGGEAHDRPDEKSGQEAAPEAGAATLPAEERDLFELEEARAVLAHPLSAFAETWTSRSSSENPVTGATVTVSDWVTRSISFTRTDSSGLVAEIRVAQPAPIKQIADILSQFMKPPRKAIRHWG